MIDGESLPPIHKDQFIKELIQFRRDFYIYAPEFPPTFDFDKCWRLYKPMMEALYDRIQG